MNWVCRRAGLVCFEGLDVVQIATLDCGCLLVVWLYKDRFGQRELSFEGNAEFRCDKRDTSVGFDWLDFNSLQGVSCLANWLMVTCPDGRGTLQTTRKTETQGILGFGAEGL